MKFNFQKLIIDNFLSFGHAEIELKDRGYTLIEGVNNNPKDCAKSNGAGKSSIFSALCFALTGETIQGISSNLKNIYTDEDMKVQLDFSVDDNNFTIIRSRDSKNHADLKIIVDGIDKSGKGIRESEQVLMTYIPELSSEILGEVIIIGQGMPHKFSNNSPSSRKEILEKLSQSDYMLEDVKTRVEKRLDTLKKEKENLLFEKTKEETNKTNLETALQDKLNERSSYNNKPDFDSLITQINIDIKNIQTRLQDCNLKLSETNKNLSGLNDNLISILNSKNNEISSETSVFNTYNTEVKSQLSDKQARLSVLTEEIKKIKAIKDICPMCGQKIPHVHKPSCEKEEEQQTILLEDINKLKEKDSEQREAFRLNKLDIENKYKQKERDLTKEIEEAKKILNAEQQLLLKLKDEESKLTIELNKITNDKNNFEVNLSKCETDIASLKYKEKTCADKLLYIIKNIENVEDKLGVLTKINTFIKRDFRGILLTNVINYLDTKCKEYSLSIFGTKELSFTLNGNNIEVTYMQKPLESLSGGEQQKVDLIIQFAIRDMMKEFIGFTSNILVLDEILDNLDSVGCDSVLNFITEKLSDIESIFIISHHADTLNIGNDSTIRIVKNEQGVSYLI